MQEIIMLIVTVLVVAGGTKIWTKIHNQTKPMKIGTKSNQKLNNTRKVLLYRYLKK